MCPMTQITPHATQPHKAENAREFYEQMELAAAADNVQGFAMCRDTFNRLVRESGNEWHKVPGMRRVYTLGPVDAPLLRGNWIVLRGDIPPGKVAKITKTNMAPPPDAPPDADTTAAPTLNDGPPLVIHNPAQEIIQNVVSRQHLLRDKAGKGRRNRYA